MATIFAWTGALRKRGQIDGISELCDFADRLEDASIKTIEGGIMTKDLVGIFEGEAKGVSTNEFLDAVAAKL